MEKQRAAGPGILQMVCGMTGVAAFFGVLAADGRDRERGGGERSLGAMFQWSAREIHLPQLLNEEALADEFSKWEQVSSVAVERFAPRPSSPPASSHTLPGFH